MDDFESEVATMLNRRARDVAGEGGVDPAVALRRGQSALRRSRALVSVAATIGVVALATSGTALALGLRPSDDSETTAPLGSATSAPATSTPPSTSAPPPQASLGPITKCSAIPPVPTNQEIDTTLDAEGKQLMFSFADSGAHPSYVINYQSDESCKTRPDIMRVVNHAIATYESLQ